MVGVIFLRSSSAVTLRGVGIDVAEDRPPSGVDDRLGRRDEGHRAGQHLLAVDFRRDHGQVQGSGRGVEGYCVADAEVVGKPLLEGEGPGTASDPAAGENLG